MKRLVVAASAAFSLATAALTTAGEPAATAATSAAAKFGAPVKVTPDLGAGYEPAAVIDRFGNIFATAHKENFQLAISPDENSPTYTRSMSWDWISSDGGKSWQDIPGLSPASLEQHDFGDEGDMILDDAGHLYFADTNVTDITLTRWTVTGLGEVAIDYHRPFAPAGEPVDDRPWIAAHLNGHVFYFGNEGDRDYPLGQGHPGNGNGPGRYTVYSSYDGGQTFDTLGYTLKSSGWCRPLAERGTKYVYAICTNDGVNDNQQSSNVGKLFAFVSSDDGHTFSRYTMGTYHANDGTQSWPTVAI